MCRQVLAYVSSPRGTGGGAPYRSRNEDKGEILYLVRSELLEPAGPPLLQLEEHQKGSGVLRAPLVQPRVPGDLERGRIRHVQLHLRDEPARLLPRLAAPRTSEFL